MYWAFGSVTQFSDESKYCHLGFFQKPLGQVLYPPPYKYIGHTVLNTGREFSSFGPWSTKYT